MADFGGLDPNYVNAIKGFEGFSPQAYGDYKQTSIGYGTRANYPGEVIDRDEANRRMSDELSKAAGYVDQFAPNLPQGARAALTSLTYNAGPGWQQSGLGNAVQQGDWERVKQLFTQYNHAGGQPNASLTSRRAAEAGWFDGAPMASAFASQGQPQMNPMQDAMQAQQPPMQQAMQQQASPGMNALNTAGNTLQRMAMWGMSVKDPSVLGALGQTQPDRKFVQIGTDDMGFPRYGWVDPRMGTVTPANGAGSAYSGDSGSGSGTQGLVDKLSQARAAGADRETLIGMVPPALQPQLRGALDYKDDYNKSLPRNSPLRVVLPNVAHAIDDTWDVNQVPARVQFNKDLINPQTKIGGQFVKQGTALQTLADMGEGAVGLNNSNGVMGLDMAATGANAARGLTAEQAAKVAAFEQKRTAYSGEKAQLLYPGSGGTHEERSAIVAPFGAYGSPTKLANALESELSIEKARSDTLQTQINSNGIKRQVIGPEAQANIDRTQAAIKALRAQAGGSQQQPTISNIRQIK